MNPRTTIGNLDESQWMRYAVQRTGVRLGNCFTYATARISEIVGYNQSLDGNTRVAGAGQLWDTHDQAFAKSAVPVPGALAIYQGLVYGHVAVVEKIEGNYIWVSQSDYGNNTDTDRDGLADGFSYAKTSGIPGQSYVNNGGLRLAGYLVHKNLAQSTGGTKSVGVDTYSAVITEASPIVMNASPERSKIDRIVIHHATTTNEASALNTWRKDGPDGTSANYLITPDKIIGCVGENYTAWHCGNWEMNKRSIGIEHLNNAGAPSWTIAEETYQNSAKLIADICKRRNIPIDDKHIIPHKAVFATACPGGIDLAKLIRMAKEVGNQPSSSAKAAAVPPSSSFRVRVSIPDLRLRSGAGLGAKVVKNCPKGVFTITETKNVDGLDWGRLKSGAGWIALKYTTKI